MAKRYEVIADALRDEIRAGRLGPGERLPAKTALAERYRVSPPTVRQALGVLRAEGLVEERHGRGDFVRAPRRKVLRSNDRHQWEKDRARAPREEREATGATEYDTGLTVSDLVFGVEYREAKADGELAAALGVPTGTRVLKRIYRTRCREEHAPFGVARSYLVYDLVAANPDLLDAANEPWPGGTHSQLCTVGIEVDRVVEQVTARPPTAEEAAELGLTAGVSVMVLRKLSIDTMGRVVDVTEVTLPGDRTELVFTTALAGW
ncbi:GntR family transcriptional regulator [Streptantibioticus ferralitis]|uniref:GntR family transcriptional regulator n=1 Tax=Streptantibioticus ferralitis TaxID=236510 RepID=A0ABT5Z6K9_9ACTN|nr:GntR family transcriptional regulator [Streptantibioticus ferralitis]MDF2259454.1 GntR family transcriptional regulator [Streptantibioticus ferralitis]